MFRLKAVSYTLAAKIYLRPPKHNGYRTGMVGKWHLPGDYIKNNVRDAVYPDQ